MQSAAGVLKETKPESTKVSSGTASRYEDTVHPLLDLQRDLGNQSVKRFLYSGLLQPKLKISHPSDIYEQEANRVAALVTSSEGASAANFGQRLMTGELGTPKETLETGGKFSSEFQSTQGRELQRSCGGCGEGAPCPECAEEEVLQRKRNDYGDSEDAFVSEPFPQIVGPGVPLDRDTRSFMESRLGHDFGRVRLHLDDTAADSAEAVNAVAFTIGRDIAFGRGQYEPSSDRGRSLLAHELTHVIQQENAPKLGRDVPRGNPVVLQRAPQPVLQRQLGCRPLVDEPEVARVAGVDAHEVITDDFMVKAGLNAVRRVVIPSAASAGVLSERCGDPPWKSSPQQFGGRAGDGIPDLAYRSGDVLEVAEIKPAALQCLYDGEVQVRNYVEKGRYPDFAGWRKGLGISTVDFMPTSRYAPTSPVKVEGSDVSVMWCEPGLLAYKAIKHSEVFACSSLSDKGAVDKFIESVLSEAQGTVDKYIDGVLDPMMTAAINRLTIRQAIDQLYRFSRGALREYIAKRAGGGKAGEAVAESVLAGLPDEAQVDKIAQLIQQEVGPRAEQELKKLVGALKATVLNTVRKRMQENLRTFIQESLTALCATAASISAALLLRKLLQDMKRFFTEQLGEAVKDLVAAFEEALKSALKPVLVVAAIAAFILLLPEEALAAIGAGIVWLVTQIIGLLPELGPVLAGAGAASRMATATP